MKFSLREFKESDAEGILSWMKDPEINQYFRFDGNSTTIESVLTFIENAKTKNDHLHYAVVNENDNYVGTISLKDIDKEGKKAEYAVSFSKSAHGTGAAVFATKEILRIAFEELGLNRIYLNVLSENIRANKFYKKMGFVYEGEFKEHLFLKGQVKDLKWYRILKKEYMK